MKDLFFRKVISKFATQKNCYLQYVQNMYSKAHKNTTLIGVTCIWLEFKGGGGVTHYSNLRKRSANGDSYLYSLWYTATPPVHQPPPHPAAEKKTNKQTHSCFRALSTLNTAQVYYAVLSMARLKGSHEKGEAESAGRRKYDWLRKGSEEYYLRGECWVKACYYQEVNMIMHIFMLKRRV